MPVYTDGKSVPGSVYPSNAVASELSQLEPLITADQLKSLFLKGIPMVLKVKDPETGLNFRITNEELEQYIRRALAVVETETGLSLMPTQFEDKLPYQRQDFEQLGYLQLPHRPISSIQSLTVKLANESIVFTFPTEWLETANMIHGQINLIPLAFSGGAGSNVVGTGSGSTVFFNSLWNRNWVSALFGVVYTTGFPDGLVPYCVNELVGTVAAQRVLSQIAAAGANNTSVSLGLDGASQSTSGPGPNKYQLRMQELAADRKLLTKKLKKLFGTAFVVGTV